jgi:hypothetical protein
MEKHTPTPWTLVRRNGSNLFDGNNDQIGVDLDQLENGEFIETAVNAYYPMLEALKDVRDHLLNRAACGERLDRAVFEQILDALSHSEAGHE